MSVVSVSSCCFFFFNDTATTEIYTLSLHDALPICDHAEERLGGVLVIELRERFGERGERVHPHPRPHAVEHDDRGERRERDGRSEEHTSELQSQSNLVCRLLLEKKKRCGTRHQLTSFWSAIRTAESWTR